MQPHLYAVPTVNNACACRPGRLDKSLYVALPSTQGRAAILRTLARSMPLDPAVDLAQLALHPQAERLSGADLRQLLREAAVAALKVGAEAFVCAECTSDTMAEFLSR